MSAGPRRRVTFALILVIALAIAGTCTACGKDKTVSGPHPTPTFAGDGHGRVLVIIADKDFNDTEFWALRDALVRAGFRPRVAAPAGTPAAGMQGSSVTPDLSIGDADSGDYVAVAVIGGSGATQLFDDARLQTLLQGFSAQAKPIGAICLAPVVLSRAGLLAGRRATVWPDNKHDLSAGGAQVIDDDVVVDGLLVTGNGPDAAAAFAQAFLETMTAAGPNAASAAPSVGPSP